MAVNFGTMPNSGRVYLVNGVYNGADAGSGVRANGPVAECVNVLPISDEELICTLQLNRRLNAQANGFFDPVGYTNTPTDIGTTAGSRVITSTGGKFSPNDAGQPIVQGSTTNIPPGTLVTSVLSPGRAVISQPSPQTGTTITATIGGGVAAHTLTGALNTTTGSTTVTLASGAFTRNDIGRVFNGTTGVPNGTTILSVTPGGQSATLSAPATANTTYTLAQASTTGGSTTLTSTALQSSDVGATVVSPNPLGIAPGTTISTVSAGTSATLSAAAGSSGGPADITLNKPVTASLYAAAAVLDGSYNLVVVSDGAPEAANTDPDYFQTDVTSSSTFTVASF
jgi:hypothetical protein